MNARRSSRGSWSCAGALEELRELARGIHPAVLSNTASSPRRSLLERADRGPARGAVERACPSRSRRRVLRRRRVAGQRPEVRGRGRGADRVAQEEAR